MIRKSSTLTNSRRSLETRRKELNELEIEVSRRLRTLTRPDAKSIRSVRREFSRRLANKKPKFIVALALNLIRQSNVPKFFAYELIQHHSKALQSINDRNLKSLGQGNDSWAEVDSFACYIAGPAWRERQVSDPLIQSWARSPDRWWRRTALVSTVPLNSKARGGVGDSRRTLRVCGMLIDDRDHMVVKALSWALRELAKRDPRSVRGFLYEHRDALAPRVLREVNSKLETGLKNPRPKGT